MELKRIKRVEAFDFDDTLAKTRSKIGVKLENDSTNFADFLEGNGLEVLDVFAYHMYSGYGLAGNLADQMMGPAFLDDAKALVRRAADAVRKVAPTMRVMVSETAAAWNSGAPNITDSFESGFWWGCV